MSVLLAQQEGSSPETPVSRLGGAADSIVPSLQRSELFQTYRGAFETTSGLPLSLERRESFRFPLDGSPRQNRFCALMAERNQSCASCLRLQQRLREEAINEPRTLECAAGLCESAVPVRVGETLVAYLQTGQVFLRRPTKSRFNLWLRENSPASDAAATGELEEAYFRTRVIDAKRYQAIIRLLAVFAQHLGAMANQIVIRESTRELPAITKARTFIAQHLTDELSLEVVARVANMNAFYFCKVFRRNTGLTFTTYLARLRIEVVKQLLLNAHMRVSEAAFAAGFQSLSQFNRVFRHVAGEAPKAFRDRLEPSRGSPRRRSAW